MRTHSIDINGKEYEFRLTSEDCIKIEEKTKVKLLDYLQDYAFTTVINLLYYMRKGVQQNFSKDDAYKLFDELADQDWAIEDIMKKIIFPTAQVSGLLTKSDLNKVLERMDNPEDQATQKSEA